MKVHTFQKNPKRSEHMKSHNIILEFVPSGICEINCRENIKNPKTSKFQGQIKDYFKIQLGGEHTQLSP
jgi:hypothetical protein